MCVSKRFALPFLVALVLSGAGMLDGCGNLGCLRNSDCGSHMECHEGECIHPNGGQTSDASAPKPEAGGAGEGTGGSSTR